MNPPEKPEESDCCGSGCNPCIFDIYQQQLDRYNKLNATKKFESVPDNKNNNCISQTKYSIFRLANITYESFNTYLYTFKYVKQNCSSENNNNGIKLLFLPGQHLLMRGTNQILEDSYFTRAYTPIINKNDDHLSFTVLIKLYNEGKMCNFIKKISINSDTYWRGPYGNYKINFGLKNILMICQGTGIAPIYSITNQIIENEACETFLKLFYCCRNSESIHLRSEIYNFASYWNFKYEIFLSQTEDKFKPKYKENIHSRKLEEHDINLYFGNTICNTNFQVLICGSDKFSNEIAQYLKNCGVHDNFVHIF